MRQYMSQINCTYGGFTDQGATTSTCEVATSTVTLAPSDDLFYLQSASDGIILGIAVLAALLSSLIVVKVWK